MTENVSSKMLTLLASIFEQTEIDEVMNATKWKDYEFDNKFTTYIIGKVKNEENLLKHHSDSIGNYEERIRQSQYVDYDTKEDFKEFKKNTESRLQLIQNLYFINGEISPFFTIHYFVMLRFEYIIYPYSEKRLHHQ